MSFLLEQARLEIEWIKLREVSLKKCSQSFVNFPLANFPLGWRTGNYWVTTSKPALQNQRCGGMCVWVCSNLSLDFMAPVSSAKSCYSLSRLLLLLLLLLLKTHHPLYICQRPNATDSCFATLLCNAHLYSAVLEPDSFPRLGGREQTRIHSQNMTECGQNAFPPILQAVPACTNVRFKASMLEDFCNSCWRNHVFYDMLWHLSPF